MKLVLLIFVFTFCTVGAFNLESIFSSIAAFNLKNWFKLWNYSSCMRKEGVSSWKIVAPIFNCSGYNFLNFQPERNFRQTHPIAIFIPSSVSDVQATVRCGYKARIQLTPNSGGHSYAGLSVGTDNSIIVDFRYMNSIEINEEEECVTLGPGALVGHINAKLWRNGGWGIGMGNCMTVAIGGHALGGGYGFCTATYGLVIDNLREVTMVDARGNALTVNSNKHPDLFWAVRGVGPGSIGISTSYKVKMIRAKDIKITHIQIGYKVKDFQNVVEKVIDWLDWAKENNDRVLTLVSTTNDKFQISDEFISPGICVHLIHIEDPKVQPMSNEAVLAAYPKYFTNSTRVVVGKKSFIEEVIETSYAPVTLQDPRFSKKKESPEVAIEKQLDFMASITKDMAFSHYTATKSFFVDKKLRARDLDEVQKVVNKIPKSCSMWIESAQGAVALRKSNESAYFHRENIFNFRFRAKSEDTEEFKEGKKWLNELWDVTRFMDNGHTFQNYPNIDLKDFLHRYYGKNLKRLRKIKAKYDPKGYFYSKQSIPTIGNKCHACE